MSPKILIIDDDPGFLSQASAALSRAGFQTLTAADAKSAEPILSKREPGIDVLVVDLVLPGTISGLDVISIVTRREKPPFKIVAVSGFYRDAVLDYICTHLGTDAYFEKSAPFNADEWVRNVRSVLNRPMPGQPGREPVVQ